MRHGQCACQWLADPGWWLGRLVGAGRRTSPVPWAAQITSRLSEEFVTRVPLADIMAGIERARAELDTVLAAALPEMVERLVRTALSVAGRDTGNDADGLTDDEATPQ